MLINFATVAAHIADVTPEQIGKCHAIIDCSDGSKFYMVESEDGKVDDEGNIVEYKVTYSKEYGFQCTCKSGQHGFANCKNPSGVCKHARWSVACAIEESEAMAEQARYNAEQAVRQALYKELNIEYTDVDTETLKRIAERNKKPAPTHYPCIQARPFSLLH
jgi:hypothetical protein